MKKPIKIPIKIPVLTKGKLPRYLTEGASGADVCANIEAPWVIPSGKMAAIPTGLQFEIPEGYEIQVRPRSGLALKYQVTVLNTPGTIDADYRGEVKILLINYGSKEFVVEPNMRIAQIVVAPVHQAFFVEVDALAASSRGSGGFGHTGVQ